MKPIIELRLLGSIELYRHLDPPGTLTAVDALLRQPKRLTLLAYLCVANRGDAVRRDTVLPMFWPELDQSRARAALRQALHFLRQHLGEQVIGARGDDLLVPLAHCRVDVVALDAALAAERWADAASLYRGPLLDGLHVAGTGEAFEQWLIGERARLHDGMRLAADEIGRAAEAAKNMGGAVRWARHAVELDPLRETPVRRLMRLLHRLGDHDTARTLPRGRRATVAISRLRSAVGVAFAYGDARERPDGPCSTRLLVPLPRTPAQLAPPRSLPRWGGRDPVPLPTRGSRPPRLH